MFSMNSFVTPINTILLVKYAIQHSIMIGYPIFIHTISKIQKPTDDIV